MCSHQLPSPTPHAATRPAHTHFLLPSTLPFSQGPHGTGLAIGAQLGPNWGYYSTRTIVGNTLPPFLGMLCPPLCSEFGPALQVPQYTPQSLQNPLGVCVLVIRNRSRAISDRSLNILPSGVMGVIFRMASLAGFWTNVPKPLAPQATPGMIS